MCLFCFSLLWYLGFHIGAKKYATQVEQKSVSADVFLQVTHLSHNLNNRSMNSGQRV